MFASSWDSISSRFGIHAALQPSGSGAPAAAEGAKGAVSHRDEHGGAAVQGGGWRGGEGGALSATATERRPEFIAGAIWVSQWAMSTGGTAMSVVRDSHTREDSCGSVAHTPQ